MNRVVWKLLRSLLILPLVGATGCAPTFDPASEIKVGEEGELRVLAVQKDKPYARPDDDVQMKILWHDGGKPKRKIQIAWLAGCYNPVGDNYHYCFSDSDLSSLPNLSNADAGTSVTDAASLDAGAGDAESSMDPDAGTGSEIERPTEGAPVLSPASGSVTFGDEDFPITIGYGEEFSFHVPEKIISSRPPPKESNVPRYGLSFVFFAVCAGELRTVEGEEFPLGCFDGDERLSSDDFIAGYTSINAYDDEAITNHNPQIKGFLLDGKEVAVDCKGGECSGLVAPASETPGSCAPNATVELCANRTNCHKPSIKPIIDQSEPAENDAVLSAIRGTDFSEQMWINYYVARGEVKSQVRLLNDAVLGWNEDYGTQLLATEAGTAYLWAVVHDNRGGTEWIRTRICVTP